MYWLILSVLLQTLAVTFAKQAGIYSNGLEAVYVVWNPWFWLQIISLAAQTLCWIKTLQRFPLSKAYPAMALSLLLCALIALWVFNETISAVNWVGLIMISLGVALVLRSPSVVKEADA